MHVCLDGVDIILVPSCEFSREPRRRLKMRFLAACMLGLMAVAGCSTWKSSESNSLPRLPRARMSKDSVGIEIATVTFDVDDGRILSSIRRELDEQIMAPEKRRQLARNGLVAGKIGSQIPEPLKLLLVEAEHKRSHPTTQAMVDGPDEQRFVQSRAGKRLGVKLWPRSNTWSATYDDGELTSDESYQDALREIGVFCTAGENSSATIKLIPDVEHGPLKQKYVAQRGSFYAEARRERVTYDELAMNFQLRAGEILLVTCEAAKPTSTLVQGKIVEQPDTRLGLKFFRDASATKQKLLLVRLAQAQIDVSFNDE